MRQSIHNPDGVREALRWIAIRHRPWNYDNVNDGDFFSPYNTCRWLYRLSQAAELPERFPIAATKLRIIANCAYGFDACQELRTYIYLWKYASATRIADVAVRKQMTDEVVKSMGVQSGDEEVECQKAIDLLMEEDEKVPPKGRGREIGPEGRIFLDRQLDMISKLDSGVPPNRTVESVLDECRSSRRTCSAAVVTTKAVIKQLQNGMSNTMQVEADDPDAGMVEEAEHSDERGRLGATHPSDDLSGRIEAVMQQVKIVRPEKQGEEPKELNAEQQAFVRSVLQCVARSHGR
jgi:DNA-binding transcriptional regulator YdaS (Cro superfamily)